MEYEAAEEMFASENEYDMEQTLTDAEEEVLAAELLGATTEAELDQFLGKLVSKASRALGGATSSLRRIAKPLVGTLKSAARKALPTLGAALGTAVPVPGVGTALGGMVGKAFSKALESELEQLDGEEQEFEAAKRFVRVADGAVRSAARTPPQMHRKAAVVRALQRGLRRARGRKSRPPGRPPQRPGARPAAASALGSTPSATPAPDAFDDAMPSDDLLGADTAPAGPAVEAGLASSADSVLDALDAPTAEPAASEWETEWEFQAPAGGSRSGRWIRRGGKIVLLGV
jgi:hypothetical protein